MTFKAEQIDQRLVPTDYPKKKSVELRKELREAQQLITECSTWRHYKGGVYRVNGHCIDTDNSEIRILYHRIDGPEFNIMQPEDDIIFARSISEWLGMIALPYGVNEKNELVIPPREFPRFIKVRKKQVDEWVTYQ